MKKKISQFLLFLFFISYYSIGIAQFSNSLSGFGDNTNYLDLNRNNFVITKGGSDLDNYHLSTLKLGVELATLVDLGHKYNDRSDYDNGLEPIDILGKFVAYRIEFTREIRFVDATNNEKANTKLRSIIVRAKSNIDPKAPCVIIASGVNSKIEDFASGLIINYTDLLMRGYVVMFIETLGSSRKIGNLLDQDRRTISDWTAYGNTRNRLGIPQDFFIDSSLYLHQLYLVGEAALNLVTSQEFVSKLRIYTNKIFALGFSQGSVALSTLVFGNRSNFPASYLGRCGIAPRDSYTLRSIPVSLTKPKIQACVVMGGTYFKLNSPIPQINIIDPSDSDSRFLYIFGRNDMAAHPFMGNIVYEGFKDLSNRLTQSKIKHYMIPICSASHTLYNDPDSIEYFLSRSNFTTMLSTIKSSSINDIFQIINSNQLFKTEYHSFKKLNTQIFQVGTNVSRFFYNSYSNSETILGTKEIFENIRCKSSINNLASYLEPYGSDSNWVFEAVDDNCKLITETKNHVIEKNILNVFPNPSTGRLTIDNSANFEFFEIIGSLGQIIEKMSTADKQKINIELNDTYSGIIYIRATKGLQSVCIPIMIN